MASDRILPIRRLLKSLPSYLLIPACRDELHRCPDLNQIYIGIIKSDYLLSPAMLGQAIDIFGFRVENFKLFYKLFYPKAGRSDPLLPL